MKKQKLSPDTIEKLEWLKARLRKYPKRYTQYSECGTQACLFGLCAPRMAKKKTITISSCNLLENLFGVTSFAYIALWAEWLGVSEKSAALLYRSLWTGKAAKFNGDCDDTPAQIAEKACQRIDLFIKSGGTI